MNDKEAIKICEGWFAHLQAQSEKSLTLQKAASLARKGEGDKARKLVNSVDRQPKVYDGARLETAVRYLVEKVRANHD